MRGAYFVCHMYGMNSFNSKSHENKGNDDKTLADLEISVSPRWWSQSVLLASYN